MSIKMADNLYMAGLHYYLYALISPLPPGTPMRRQKLSSDEGRKQSGGGALSRKSPHGWSRRRLGNSAAAAASPLALFTNNNKNQVGQMHSRSHEFVILYTSFYSRFSNDKMHRNSPICGWNCGSM